MANLFVFGDSIVWGEHDPKSFGWVGRIRQYVESEKKDISVYNFGICGETTAGLLNRIEPDMSSLAPDIVIIAVGINDTVYLPDGWTQISKDDFKRNIKKLTRIVETFTQNIIFVGMTRMNDKVLKPVPWSSRGIWMSNERVQTYDDIVQSECKSNEVEYIDVSSLLSKNDLADGLHPNGKGYDKLYSVIKDFLINKQFI